jgi:hypothetical protein
MRARPCGGRCGRRRRGHSVGDHAARLRARAPAAAPIANPDSKSPFNPNIPYSLNLLKQGWQLALRPRSDQRSKRLHDGWVRGGGSGLNVV